MTTENTDAKGPGNSHTDHIIDEQNKITMKKEIETLREQDMSEVEIIQTLQKWGTSEVEIIQVLWDVTPTEGKKYQDAVVKFEELLKR